MEGYDGQQLPDPMRPLTEDSRRIWMLVRALKAENDPTMRAELAELLVRSCALFEDAKRHPLENLLSTHGEHDLAEEFGRSAKALGESMRPVYDAVHAIGFDGRATPPDGFEHALGSFIKVLQLHLEFEQRDVYPVLRQVSGREASDLRARFLRARLHALEHPLPPENPVARWFMRLGERMEHLRDTSEQYRPGADRLAS